VAALADQIYHCQWHLAKVTLAEVIKEMAKPRVVAMSAREDGHIVLREVLVAENNVQEVNLRSEESRGRLQTLTKGSYNNFVLEQSS
jgi:hypothetical protein